MRGYDFPLTRSLGWWLCLTTKQTVIHMSVRAGPVFIWSSSTEAPLKAKELRGQGFKAVSFLRHTSHYRAPCVTLYLREWRWLLGGSRYIYVGLHKCVLIARGEWVVTVKNSHRKPCHFTGTASGSTFVSCMDTLPHLVMSVGYQKKQPVPIYLDEYGKYICGSPAQNLPRQVSIAVCMMWNFSLFVRRRVLSPRWECFQIKNV